MKPILILDRLTVDFATKQGTVHAVRDISLSVNKGEILAIVGESGCGKTVMCKSVMKLLPRNAKVYGNVFVDGENIMLATERKMRCLRGTAFSMLFQDSMTSLTPTIPVGQQIIEALLSHNSMSKSVAEKKTIELLELVGMDYPKERMRLQPHFLSGGMRQRCILAIALALSPKILFADEPTTALDVTVQAAVLDLLIKVKNETGVTIIFITHDLGVVAKIADRVAVMYAGKIVEIGTAQDIFYDPRHPYTWGLLRSHPSFALQKRRLHCIPGNPPNLINLPTGDAFAPRNEFALDIDFQQTPPMFSISQTHSAATWLLDRRAPKISPPVIIKRTQ
ncbi:TPA: ABC transporter ATP-binding protein [Salmonella enterica subsp. diarizonae serovar 60-67:z35:-]